MVIYVCLEKETSIKGHYRKLIYCKNNTQYYTIYNMDELLDLKKKIQGYSRIKQCS